MNREELFGWLALKAVPGLGDVLYKRLIEKFGSPQAVFAAAESELLCVEGMRPPIAQAIRTGMAAEAVSKELDGLEQHGVEIVTILDEDYPELLRSIHDPPPLLYLKGELLPEDRQAMAIVGSRHCSEYGRAVARRMGQELARRGFTIVSGLARGIDAAAHEGALSVGGRTLGVLGCGVDVAYPREHKELKVAISKQGAILSEFALGTAPQPENFPRRNRVISGLCLGVIVVEAADQSGALITATSALEQGREVFAVPGPIGSKTSVGTHRLIKQGAKLIEGVEDILEEISCLLQPLTRQTPDRGGLESVCDRPLACQGLNAEEQTIYELLSHEPRHMDDLTVQAGRAPSEMAGLLLQLELKGAARQLAGHMYIRVE